VAIDGIARDAHVAERTLEVAGDLANGLRRECLPSRRFGCRHVPPSGNRALPGTRRVPGSALGACYAVAGSFGVSASWSFAVSSSESEVLITVPP
jgi:hypothetical protein